MGVYRPHFIKVHYFEQRFECNDILDIHYKYLEQCEKERKLTDAEKADKKNIEILKKW